ncbi:uncharacterized protein CLAFUR5_00893 [Fulvia fulva]|uniref:Uncharacterized protein n=1 Tax=Passalora fulva TaxID=5499 RepID=A0A9Q8P3G5_PASFU|nr:uncharacterized protein CLAFUR5_00893 [Fulvia fulva]KAK4637841.1 hypothetical protein CLAFUR0_00891 [Fulvia fulva]UJO11774.1 hypothetical protein CLAFUR5_00893 [Fulvia fulva]
MPRYSEAVRQSRLSKIKALNGGVAPPEEVVGGPAVPQKASIVDDPDEVDISQGSSFANTPSARRTPANASDDPLAAAMLRMQQEQGFLGGQEEDPMAKMMQQMMSIMGQGGGDPNDPNSKPPELPPMLANMLSGQKADDVKEPATSSAYIWRIVHAIFSFVLASYICLTSTFNGSKLARSENVYTQDAGYGLGPRLFVIFTSAELVLQSTRYFMEKGQMQSGGMLAGIVNSGMIPQPYANYIRIAGRYITIAQTVFADVMVVVFVLGCMAWWTGNATPA